MRLPWLRPRPVSLPLVQILELEGIRLAVGRMEGKVDKLMPLNATVAALVDGIAKLKDIDESVLKGIDVLKAQNTALQAQVSNLQAKVDAGTGISSDDLNALSGGLTMLGETMDEMKPAILTGTDAAPATGDPAPVTTIDPAQGPAADQPAGNLAPGDQTNAP